VPDPTSADLKREAAIKPLRLDYGALADDPEAEPETTTGGWDLYVAPFLWAPNLDGTLSAKGISVDVDADFTDYFENIDFAIFGRIEASKERWHLFLEGMYAEGSNGIDVNRPLSSPGDLSAVIGGIGLQPPTVPPPGTLPPPLQQKVEALADLIAGGRSAKSEIIDLIRDVEPHPTIDNIDFDLDMTMIEFGVGYRIKDWQFENGQKLGLDLFAGARYWHVEIETKLGVTPGLLEVLPNSVTLKGSSDWLDPLVGGRLHWQASEKLILGVRGDVGGFGIGSELTWSVLGLLQYEVAPNVSLFAGYRALDIDYADGSGDDRFEFDALMQGPVLGAIIWF
jgi:hypothetical protein